VLVSPRRPPNPSDLFGTLPAGTAERWRRLEALAAGWFDEPPSGEGVPEEELVAAEARLGVSLPRALREAYLRFGRRDELTLSNDDALLPPERLRIRGGVLFFWDGGDDRWNVEDEWGIRVEDLALDDPPVVYVYRTERLAGAAPKPALAGADTGLSRFFLRMALGAVCAASRYRNALLDLGAEKVAEVTRGLARLDLGELVRPPAEVFYGAEGVILTAADDEDVRLAASDQKSYRRAVEKLAGLPFRRTEEEARRSGAYRETRLRTDEEMARIRGGLLAEMFERKPEWAARMEAMVGTSEWAGTLPVAGKKAIGGGPQPIDARLGALVDAAIAPYRRLLPPPAIEVFRRQAVAVVETHTSTAACWFWLFHGGPPPPGKPLRVRQHPRIVPIGGWLTKEQKALFDHPFDADDNDLDTFMRRYTPAMARLPPDGPPAEEAVLARACATLARFVAFAPFIPAPNERAAERALAPFLELVVASLFAGVIASFMGLSKDAHIAQCIRYVPARLIFDRMLLLDPEMETFAACYAGDADTRDEAKRLGLTTAEAHERHRSFLARLGPAFADGVVRLLREVMETTDLPNPEAAQWARAMAFRATYAGKKMPD
jgi:hypothetical protein